MLQKHDIIVTRGGRLTECPYLVTRIEDNAYYGVYQKTGEPHTPALIPAGEYDDIAPRPAQPYYTINTHL